MGFAVALVVAVVGTGYGIGGWIRLLVAIAAGAAVYLGAAGVAATIHAWQTSRRAARQSFGPTKGSHGNYPHHH
jgi:hypothetical protein